MVYPVKTGKVGWDLVEGTTPAAVKYPLGGVGNVGSVASWIINYENDVGPDQVAV